MAMIHINGAGDPVAQCRYLTMSRLSVKSNTFLDSCIVDLCVMQSTALQHSSFILSVAMECDIGVVSLITNVSVLTYLLP